MILTKLDRHADEARQRYESLTVMWQGLYSRALSDPDLATGTTAGAVVREAYGMAESYLEAEKDHIIKAIDGIASDAHQAVREHFSSNDADELTDAALDHLTQTQNYLSDEIIAQIHRDIALVRRTLQNTALTVSTLARGRRVSFRAALIEHRIKNPEELDFGFVDRRFRRSPAKTFIGSIWRYALLSAFNETTLMDLSERGLDRVGIRRLVDGVETQGEVISITGADGLQSYAEIRTSIFHPNARSWLAAELASV